MSSAELQPVYLLTGSDLPKIALAVRRLRARFEEGSVEHLFAESATGEAAVAATNALGLLGGGERLVLVDGIERWKKADTEAVAGYLASPTPGAVLALVGDPSRLAGLEDACGRAGEVLRFDVPVRPRGRPDYPTWVRAQFQRAGLRVDQEAAERLVELAGDDAFVLQSEVEKLAAWAGDDPVGVREVELLAAPTAETSDFALVDAWGARDVVGVLAASEARLREKEAFIVLARLADYVGRVRAVHALVERDVGVREIAARLGLKEYPARKQAKQAENFTRDELDDALVRLAEADLALKGGSRLSAELELERALVDVTAGRRGNPG